MKIYVHHLYTTPLFYKVAHNTTNRIENIINQKGSIFCKYKTLDLEFIFDDIIHHNDDGLHLFDSLEFFRLKSNNFLNVAKKTKNEIYAEITHILSNSKNWIILFLYTDKIFNKYDDTDSKYKTDDIENYIELLQINNTIITDQFFLDKELEKTKYPNHNFTLTNTIFHWNEWASIRFYYEFKNIFEKLNQPYDIGFSVYFHKVERVELICELAKLNNPKIFLSRKSPIKKSMDYRIHQNPEIMDIYSNIIINNKIGNNFDDISFIAQRSTRLGLDLFFRILPMSKIQIVAESWDWWKKDYKSIFLSEKTYGMLLANIPFIPTHTYPLDIIQALLDLNEYPFYNEIKKVRGNQIEFAKFIETFMMNIDDNLILIKEWTNLAHQKLMDKINNENSMLDLIVNDSIKIRNQYKRTLL
jgi:hypothetical protein